MPSLPKGKVTYRWSPKAGMRAAQLADHGAPVPVTIVEAFYLKTEGSRVLQLIIEPSESFLLEKSDD
jgi:hypothetical protein